MTHLDGDGFALPSGHMQYSCWLHDVLLIHGRASDADCNEMSGGDVAEEVVRGWSWMLNAALGPVAVGWSVVFGLSFIFRGLLISPAINEDLR